MKQKILISGLSLLLTFSLVGCGGQQAQQEPQEPDQEKGQQTEPASTTPPVESMGVKNENDTAIYLSNSDSEIGLISNQEKQDLSEAELLEYFQTVYDIHLEIHTSTTQEGIMQEELDFLVSLVDSDGKTLPSDYEARYRAWRPESLPADIQTGNETEQQSQQTEGQQQGQQNNQQSSGQQQPGGQQIQQPSGGQQQQGQTQTSKPSGSTYDPYDGYGSYNAMIDAYCKRYPELSREEIMQRIPDPAGIHVDENQAAKEAQEGLLNNVG